ncbi:hypothetical protein ACLMJK_005871 [Lecanora helva]
MADMAESNVRLESSHFSKGNEWERKQRNREYRVASRREKRNRKGDEKRQRKLNATILRRMTRNPEKYNKNAERNRLRDIESERRKIRHEAILQAQRLAAIHDPSGVTFNVGPVVLQEDGSVITEETLRRRKQRALEKAAAEQAKEQNTNIDSPTIPSQVALREAPPYPENNVKPDRPDRIDGMNGQQPQIRLSKTQQKKRAALEPRPPPPKPIIPDGVSIPEGEEAWLALWDMADEQLERRLIREKRRKAAERKALRLKQKSGKAERRAARDEKRKVYRDIKLTWKSIKEEQVRERTLLKSKEDEESKKIAVDINIMERKAALDRCEVLGFTFANTPGIEDVKPRALGMKGVEVDFDAINISESRSDAKLKNCSKRVNLGNAPTDAKAEYVPIEQDKRGDGDGARDVEEYIKFDVGEGQDFETLNYNHKLRRKLRRAIDNAEIRKEMLVRQRALDYYGEKQIEAPQELQTPCKPTNVRGQRILEDGTYETPKQERIRTRMELTEFNLQMRVLRKQAKDAALYAGLRKHAQLTGKIPIDTSHSQLEMSLCQYAPVGNSMELDSLPTNQSANVGLDGIPQRFGRDSPSVPSSSDGFT